jgi:hypothetical protein
MRRQTFLAVANVEARMKPAEPVTAPGVPKNYPDAKKLVTEDCIKPAQV